MALAGYQCTFYAMSTSSSAGSGDELDGIQSLEYSQELDILDITDFKDTGTARKKLSGLSDGSVSLSGDFEPGDSPQGVVRTAAGDGTSVWLTLHFYTAGSSGSKGFKVETKVKGYKISASVDGKVTWSADFVFNAAPSAV